MDFSKQWVSFLQNSLQHLQPYKIYSYKRCWISFKRCVPSSITPQFFSGVVFLQFLQSCGKWQVSCKQQLACRCVGLAGEGQPCHLRSSLFMQTHVQKGEKKEIHPYCSAFFFCEILCWCLANTFSRHLMEYLICSRMFEFWSKSLWCFHNSPLQGRNDELQEELSVASSSNCNVFLVNWDC